MTTETQKNALPKTTDGQKNTYTPPRLIIYGQVRSLTQSGASGSNENSQGPKPHMAQSERFAKDNIVKIGAHPLGFNLYLFDYKPDYRDTWGHGRQFGVMVDEVERIMPEAISIHPDGYKIVNYTMLGICRTSH